MTAAPLRVVHLTKRYRTQDGGFLDAVSDISFEVQRRVCFGLLGPNGAGNSTPIQCISGFYPPSSGRVFIGEIDVHADPKHARQALGLCAQEDTLDSDFRVFDQLVRYATFFQVPSAEGARRARALLERFGIADKANELVEHLSGGMKRRLQVARALISGPSVLVLDEPTTGLDPRMRRSLWEILIAEREKCAAILLSTHYMEEAERLCDRVALLDKGVVRDIGSPRSLVERHMGAAAIIASIGVATGDFPLYVPLAVVPVAFPASLLFAGLGLAVAARSRTIEEISYPQYLLVFPMFLFCGVFFPVEQLPGALQWIAWALPLTAVNSLMRSLTLGFPLQPWSIPILVVWLIGLVAYSRRAMFGRLVK